MAPRNFTVDSKVDLLEHLIETSQTWDDPDLAAFFAHAQSTFEGFKGTTWDGADLEDKLRNEERHWLSECDGSKSRRRGHEKGSYYDNAMARWKKIWNELLIKDWQNEVDNGRPFNEVPETLRKDLVPPRNEFAAAPPAPVHQPKSKPRLSPAKAPLPVTKMANVKAMQVSTTNTAKAKKLEFEYDGDKLKRVVDAATQRAREIGKQDLADAVQMIYHDSLENFELRYLLEHILKQTADQHQNERFQDYVRAAKRKIKMRKTSSHKTEMDMEVDRRTKKLLYRAEVAKTIERETPAVTQKSEKLCTEKTWSSKCPCPQCVRDKAEYDEDTTGIADAEHQRKYEEFMRINGLDAAKPKGPSRAPPLHYQSKKEPVSKPQSPEVDNDDGGVRIVDTPDAQLGAEQEQAQRSSAQSKGSPASAETGVPSDSGYETTEKQPHHDPLVTKILGDLQYEPAVKILLQHNRALPTSANIKNLRQRETALEIIRKIVTETPAARNDLEILADKLAERNAREAKENGEVSAEDQAMAGAEDDSDDLSEEEDSEDEYEEELNEEVTPRSRRSLRTRLSTAEVEEAERINAERRRNHKWPCPLASEANCDQWFSSSGHAVRHGKIHTGVKDFTCPACDKPFARKDNMMEHFRGVHKNRLPSKKRDRRHSTQSSTAVAEEADRLAEERAAKRRKSARQARKDDVESAASRESSVVSSLSTMSSLTEMSSTDEEPAKDKPSNTGSSKVITQSVTQTQQVVVRNGAPEPASTTLARLEAKIDALLGNRTTNSTSSRPDAENAMISSAESLLNIATSLQSGAMNGQSPELTQFVARLTRTAAEAVIEAADSAKNSAVLARDISTLMLEEHGHGPEGQLA